MKTWDQVKLWSGFTTAGTAFIATYEMLPHLQAQFSTTANITLGTVDVLIPGAAAILLARGVVWVAGSMRQSKLITSDKKHAVMLQQGHVLNITAEEEQYAAIGRSSGTSTAQRLLDTAPVEEITEALALPLRSTPFSAMHHHITPQREILGWTGTDWVYGDPLRHTLSIGVIGRPGQGKTSLLRYLVASAAKRGATVRGWDLHGDIVNELGDMFDIFDDPKDIIADADWLMGELNNRTALRKRAQKKDPRAMQEWDNTEELFYLTDEFTALMTRLKGNKNAQNLLAQVQLLLIVEGRKLKMRSVIAGQSLPAALFGDDGSIARDNLQTRYAFGSRDAQARMLGIPEDAIDELLPVISGEEAAGYAVLDGGPLRDPVIVSVPFTTVADVSALMTRSQNVAVQRMEALPVNPALTQRPYEVTSATTAVLTAQRPAQRSEPITDPLLVVRYNKQDLSKYAWTEPAPLRTNSVNEWIAKRVEKAPGQHVAVWECFYNYVQYCIDGDVEPLADNEFSKQALALLTTQYGVRHGDPSGKKVDGSVGQRRSYMGVVLKELV